MRKEYLSAVTICEICSERKATELHHVDGRRGDRLCDVDNILGVCRVCHGERIHGGVSEGYGPSWAREQGYLK